MMAFILKDWAKLPNRPRFGRIASVWASSEPYLRPKVRDGGIDKFLKLLGHVLNSGVWTTMWPCVLKTTSWARAIPNCRCVSNQIYWFIDWLIDRDRQYPSTCIILCALCQRCEINYPTPWMLKSHITWDLQYWNHCLPIFFLAWRFMRPLLTKS